MGTSQTCYESQGYIHGLGNLVYIGYDAVNYPDNIAVFEIKKDLSSIIFHGYESFGWGQSVGYSKSQKYYGVGFSGTAFWIRHQGGGVFSELTSLPNVYNNRPRVITDGVKLRVVSQQSSSVYGFWESSDGETWTLLNNYTVAFLDQPPCSYVKFGTRLVYSRDTQYSTNQRFRYSDDNGLSWTDGSGVSGSGWGGTSYYQGGGGLVAFDPVKGGIYGSTDGAAFSTVASLNLGNDISNALASNGSGGVVISIGSISASLASLAYSTNHGASFTTRTGSAAGIPDGTTVFGVFWTGTQYVMAVKNGSSLAYQLFTSPTGASWTSGMVVPDFDVSNPNQVAQIIA